MVRSYTPVFVRDERFAPSLPRIDLETMEILDAPENGTQFPKPPPMELDTLLFSEAYQRSAFGGLTAPELILFNDTKPIPHLADPVLDLKIHEDEWLRFLRRDHWIRLDRRIEGTLWYWDPSDDEVWKVFRPILELTDRMMKLALDHRWLYSLMSTDSLDWVSDVKIFGQSRAETQDEAFTIPRFLPQREKNKAQVDAVLKQLERLIVFTFDSDDTAWAKAETHRAGADGHTVILLTTETLEMLFDEDYTEMEKRQREFVIASTLVHELMHAISAAMCSIHRRQLGLAPEQWSPWKPKNRGDTELWYEDQRWQEMGLSFTLDFLGADLQTTPNLPGIELDTVNHYARGHLPPDAIRNGLLVYKKPNDKADILKANSSWTRMIPALWFEAHYQEDFWDWVRKSGDGALRVPLLAHAVRYYRKNGMTRYWRALLDRNGDINAPPGLVMQLRRIADNVIHLRRKVHALRGAWYKESLARWQATPYSDVMRRNKLTRIAEGFRNRNVPAEVNVAAHDIYVLVVDREVRSGSTDTFYLAIGQLVEDALPVRYAPVLINPGKPASPATDLYHKPSYLDPNLADSFPLKEDNPNVLDLDGSSSLSESGKPPSYLYPALEDGKPSHKPLVHLYSSLEKFDTWALTAPLPLGVVTEFRRAWRTSLVSLERCFLANVWHEYDFQLPVYEDRLSLNIDRDHFYGTKEFPDNASPLDSPTFSDTLPSAKMARPVKEMEWSRYLTVGEVGDHQFPRDGEVVSCWGLRWSADKTEVLVYDISEIVTQLPENMTVMDILAERTEDMMEMGLMIRKELDSPWAEKVNKLKPIGLVAIARRREDVYTNDGKDGRKRWMILGPYVYDVTSALLSVNVQPDISDSIQRSTGINPARDLLYQKHIPAGDVVKQLEEHKIGYLRDELDYVSVSVRVFTDYDLAWHVDDEHGYYVAVDGFVYDLTEYRHIHPGGQWALERLAGQDITQVFREAHETDIAAIQRLHRLRIGMHVKQHGKETKPDEHEICLGKYIYDLRPLRLSKDEKIEKWWEKSEPWRGLSVGDMESNEMDDGYTWRKLTGLRAILAQPEWMWKTVKSKRELTYLEMARFDEGSLSQYNGKGAFPSLDGAFPSLDNIPPAGLRVDLNEGLVAAEGLVFNVFSLVYRSPGMHIEDKHKEALVHNMGKDLTTSEPETAAWLFAKQKHRIVGTYNSAPVLAASNDAPQLPVVRPPKRMQKWLNDPVNSKTWTNIDALKDKPLARFEPSEFVVAPIMERMETEEDGSPFRPSRKKARHGYYYDTENPRLPPLPREPAQQPESASVQELAAGPRASMQALTITPRRTGHLPAWDPIVTTSDEDDDVMATEDPTLTSSHEPGTAYADVDWTQALGQPAEENVDWTYNPAMATGYGALPATGTRGRGAARGRRPGGRGSTTRGRGGMVIGQLPNLVRGFAPSNLPAAMPSAPFVPPPPPDPKTGDKRRHDSPGSV